MTAAFAFIAVMAIFTVFVGFTIYAIVRSTFEGA